MNSKIADFLETFEASLTAKTLCDALGVDRDSTYRWVVTGQLKAINSNGPVATWRFPAKEAASWVRERHSYYHGPCRPIALWLEDQVMKQHGPHCLPLGLARVIEKMSYDWKRTAERIATDRNYSYFIFNLTSDIWEAVNTLPIAEQFNILRQINSGRYDETKWEAEEAE